MNVLRALSSFALLAFAACGDDTGTGGGADTSASVTTSGVGSSNATSASTATASASTTAQASSSTGAQADTWTSFASDFMTTYCHECHGSGDASRDYSLLATVMDESAEIRCGVAAVRPADCTGFPPPKQFPIPNGANDNPKPTDADRDRLVAWIEAGLPE
jgi:hypothetical protein